MHRHEHVNLFRTGGNWSERGGEAGGGAHTWRGGIQEERRHGARGRGRGGRTARSCAEMKRTGQVVQHRAARATGVQPPSRPFRACYRCTYAWRAQRHSVWVLHQTTGCQRDVGNVPNQRTEPCTTCVRARESTLWRGAKCLDVRRPRARQYCAPEPVLPCVGARRRLASLGSTPHLRQPAQRL